MKAHLVRKYFAAVSVGMLILVASFAFVNLRGTYSVPPPILDPNFKLWANNSMGPELMVWDREYVKSSFDQVTMKDTMANGRDAVELGIFQSGAGLVYEGLTQTQDGGRLSALLGSTVGLWFMKEPCHCDGDPFNKTAVTLALEVNDGIHTITFLFSDKFNGTLNLLNHRIEFRPAPSGTWTFQEFNFAKEYAAANWHPPSSLTFRVIFGVAEGSSGWHYAYLNRITIYCVEAYPCVPSELRFSTNSLDESPSLTANPMLVPTTMTSRNSD